jgi:hypothetical protein
VVRARLHTLRTHSRHNRAVSLQGGIAAERPPAATDFEPSPRRALWLALVAILAVPLLVISGVYLLQLKHQRSAYLNGYAVGHKWQSDPGHADCLTVGFKLYRSDSRQAFAFEFGCLDGLRGLPKDAWRLTGYHDNGD